MTYYIASAIGLAKFKTKYKPDKVHFASEAYVIAWAATYIDYNSSTRPDIVFGGTDVRRKFHFRAPKGSELEGASNAAKEVLKQGIKLNDLMLTGIGIHILQDSFSHTGYEASVGHLNPKKGDEPNPDYPWVHPTWALRMAEATYVMLAQFLRRNHKMEPQVPFRSIAKDLLRLFTLKGPQDGLGPYDKEVAARVANWKAAIERKFGKGTLQNEGGPFSYTNRVGEPWTNGDFVKAAKRVNLPTTP
jgi:hypothetical protein